MPRTPPSRWTWWAVCLCPLGCSVAPDTPAAGPGKSYSAYVAEATGAILKYEERCGLLDPTREAARKAVLLAGSFPDSQAAPRDASAAAGRVSYDASCITAALSATTACRAGLVQRAVTLCAAQKATGRLAAGRLCQLPEECQAGTYCKGIPAGAQCGSGTCAPAGAVGSLCPEGDRACDAAIAICRDGACLARLAAGSTCQQDTDCQSGLSCIKPDISAAAGACNKPSLIAQGGPCDPMAGQPCDAGLSCYQDASLNYRCQPQVKAGQPCRSTEACEGTETCVRAARLMGTALRGSGTSFTSTTTGVPGALYGVFGSSSSDVWAVGEAGAILHWTGSAWSAVAAPAQALLHGVWGAAPNDVWAVGDGGTTLHYTGSAFRAVASGTLSGLRAISGTAANNVWAVGEAGLILRYNGSVWSSTYVGTEHLNAVWAASSTEAWAVGDNGTALHFVGGAWTAVPTNLNRALLGVWGSGPSDVWIVGETPQTDPSGIILRWNGAALSPMTGAPQRTLYAVAGTGKSDVWITGEQGTVLRYTGASLTSVPSGTDRGLLSAWTGTTGEVWAVGQPAQPPGACQPLGGPGQACSVDAALGSACQNTLRCYSFSGGAQGLCTPQPLTGERCALELPCLLGVCDLGQADPSCRPRVGAGLACSVNEDCQSGVCDATARTCRALACM